MNDDDLSISIHQIDFYKDSSLELILQGINQSIELGDFSIDGIYRAVLYGAAKHGRVDVLSATFDQIKKEVEIESLSELLESLIMKKMPKTAEFFIDQQIPFDLTDRRVLESLCTFELSFIEKLHKNGYPITDDKFYLLTFSLRAEPPRFDIFDYFEKIGVKQSQYISLMLREMIFMNFEEDKKKIDYFLSKGMDVNTNNSYLLKRSIRGQAVEVLEHIISHGATLDTKDKSLLELCIKHESSAVIQLLVENGVELHKDDSPFMIKAATEGTVPIVKYLADYGLDLEVARQYGTNKIREFCAAEFFNRMQQELPNHNGTTKKLKL